MIRSAYATALALALMAMPLSGQGIELKAGMNISTLSGDAVVDAAREIGVNFGVGFIIPIAGDFGLNLGTNFSKKGVTQVVDGVTTFMDLSYIEIPVLFRLGLLSAGPTSLHVVLGPNFGINTGCETTDVLAATPPTDCGPDIKNTDIGGVAGLGVSFALGGIVSFGLDMTYNMGMTSLGNATSSFDGLKNSTLTMQSHLGFSLF